MTADKSVEDRDKGDNDRDNPADDRDNGAEQCDNGVSDRDSCAEHWYKGAETLTRVTKECDKGDRPPGGGDKEN